MQRIKVGAPNTQFYTRCNFDNLECRRLQKNHGDAGNPFKTLFLFYIHIRFVPIAPPTRKLGHFEISESTRVIHAWRGLLEQFASGLGCKNKRAKQNRWPQNFVFRPPPHLVSRRRLHVASMLRRLHLSPIPRSSALAGVF